MFICRTVEFLYQFMEIGPLSTVLSTRKVVIQVFLGTYFDQILAALRNVSGLGRRFTLFDRLLTDASLDGIFDQSLHDEPVGLSNAQINRLPRTKPTRSQINSSGKVRSFFLNFDIKLFSLECTICMDTYKENDDLLTLPCFHIFHYNCIKPWFSGKHECPVCRADVRETGAPPTQG